MRFISEFGQFILLAIVFLITYSGVSFASSSDDEVPYQVACAEEGRPPCKVDKATYKGWRTYHSTCHVCHAQDAIGSTFAPSLLLRLKGMDKEKIQKIS